jgi:rod shape-determining protein MreC
VASFGSDSRPIIGRGPSLVARFLLLSSLSIGLMVADHRNHYLTSFRSLLSTSVYPIYRLVDAPFSFTHWLTYALTDRAELRRENIRLITQVRDLQVSVQTLAAVTAENQRLRELGNATAEISKKRLIATIMNVDLDPLRHRVLLNKGQVDGVFKGQSILDAYGVFGQITQVGRYTSEAILISDPEHGIPVRVNRSGLRTIASGTGNLNKLNLPFLTGAADIKVGDLLISSGLGGIFPAGYPVGIVTKMERNPAETFATVEAKPLAKLDSEYEVVLIWYQPPAVEPAVPVAELTEKTTAEAKAKTSTETTTPAIKRSLATTDKNKPSQSTSSSRSTIKKPTH